MGVIIWSAAMGVYGTLVAIRYYNLYQREVQQERERKRVERELKEAARRGFKREAHAEQDYHFRMMLEEMK